MTGCKKSPGEKCSIKTLPLPDN